MSPQCDLPDVSALYERPAWHQDAACRGLGTEVFIFEPHSPTRTLVKFARQICAECRVRCECLSAALADPELVGTWGGTSAEERKAMRREIARLLDDGQPDLAEPTKDAATRGARRTTKASSR